jgi:uncharacterized protein (DUF433 family)
MSELYRITVDPSQCGGRPCLRGLRIRVRDILDLLAAGATREEILADYPLLEAGDITAARIRGASERPSSIARGLMRFIVDAQLPPALARLLASNGHEAEHVANRNMASVPDKAGRSLSPGRKPNGQRAKKSKTCWYGHSK